MVHPSSLGWRSEVLPILMRYSEPTLPGMKLWSLEVMVHFTAKSVVCCKNIVTLSERSSDISEWTLLATSLT